jgi:photosystem II stability/assembly factor-like uncharacterized protein
MNKYSFTLNPTHRRFNITLCAIVGLIAMVKKQLIVHTLPALFFIFLFLLTPARLKSQWVKQIDNVQEEFRDQPGPDDMYLDVYFLPSNPDYGWVCGFGGRVARTTDGGKNWFGTSVTGTNQLESIHFVNEKVGFLVDVTRGIIFKSEDSGDTWKIITTANQNLDLWGCHFYNEDVGVALGGGTCLGQGRLYAIKTTDGGDTWETRSLNTNYYTKFSDPLILDENGGGYAVSSGLLMISDNGLDWRIESGTGGYDWHEEVTYLNGSSCLPWSAGCEGTFAEQGGYGGIRMRTNNHDWINYTTGETMYGSFLISENEAWACGSNAAVYYTSDGGVTWELRNCGIAPDENTDDIWFIDEDNGWLVGDGIFKYTPVDTIPPKILPDTLYCGNEEAKVWVKETPNRIQWFVDNELYASGVDTISVFDGDTIRAYVEYRDRPFCGFTEEYTFNYYPDPELEIIGGDTLMFCEDDSVSLMTAKEYAQYYWSNGENTREIFVADSGIYSVTIVDTNGCQTATSVEVFMAPKPEYDLQMDAFPDICIGDSIEIKLSGDFTDFVWHYIDTLGTDTAFDSTNTTVKVTDLGWYYIEAENEFGCGDISDTLFLNVRIDSNSFTYKFEAPGREEPFEDTSYPKLACRYLTIENITELDQTLDDAFFLSNIEFSVPPNQLPLTIPAREKGELKVCFTAYALETRRDTFVILDNCFNHYIPMRAESLGNEYSGEGKCDIWLDFETNDIDRSFVAFFDKPYPNPSNTGFTVNAVGDIEAIENADIRIYDLEGKAVPFEYDVKCGTSSGKITISHNLTPGSYLLVIKSGSEQYTYQFRAE